MKYFIPTMLLLSQMALAQVPNYEGSEASQVWNTIMKNPYTELPSYEVSYKNLFKEGVDLITQSASRTLAQREDILPEFNKLAHPNGVCLKGQWHITEQNPYSGLFQKDSRAIIIARASVALSETTSNGTRGFGFAGKLFPTTDPDKKVETANFFLVDDLGGTSAKHYTDVELTNEPKVSMTLAVLSHIKYALTVASTFGKIDSNPGIRQVYEIADSTKNATEKTRSPQWMMVKAAPTQFKVDEPDFRDELNSSIDQGGLVFDIYVANTEKNSEKDWKKIGEIRLNEAIPSKACDHQLHFHHPRWRSDLAH